MIYFAALFHGRYAVGTFDDKDDTRATWLEKAKQYPRPATIYRMNGTWFWIALSWLATRYRLGGYSWVDRLTMRTIRKRGVVVAFAHKEGK